MHGSIPKGKAVGGHHHKPPGPLTTLILEGCMGVDFVPLAQVPEKQA